MSQIGAPREANDTHLMPVLFPNGTDRRASARVPLSTPVRIGPPNGTPYALVSASDLSKGGLFIDADRPVRVGALFSAEIELAGVKIYVPEAEVAYNRERENGSGFGVRFVTMDPEALEAVASEVDRVTDQTLVVRDRRRTAGTSDLPTLIPSKRPHGSGLGVELSQYPEPEIVGEALDAGSVIGSERPSGGDRMRPTIEETRQRFTERAKTAPRVFRALTIGGAAAMIASAGVALFEGSQGGAVHAEPITVERGVTDSTHHVLMGQADADTLERAAPIQEVRRDERRRPLPPLVILDEAPKAEKVDTPKPKPAPAVEPIAPAAAPKVAPKAAPTKEARAEPQGRATRIAGIDPGARVLKTHVFHGPERFVIDVVGQSSPVAATSLASPARAMRTGKHPEFSRIVIDTDAELLAGRAHLSNGILVVELVRK
jgi:hypothetical protein